MATRLAESIPPRNRRRGDDALQAPGPLPLLQQLEAVGPDVHAILETVQNLQDSIEAFPGMGLLKKRADRDDED